MEVNRKRQDHLFERFLLYMKNSIVGHSARSFILFCIGCMLCVGSHFLMPKEANVSVSLNYENSERNLSPNGTYLNIYTTFRNRDILQRAIDRIGLTGQITPDELNELLGIRIQGLDRAKHSTSFVATSYVLTLKNSKLFGNLAPEQILDQLCCVYREYFTELSGNLAPFFSVDITKLSEGELLSEADILKLRAQELQGYISDRIKENKNYKDSEMDVSFLDLSGQIEEFINYDANELTTYIIENGLVEDKNQMVSTLRYRRRVVKKEYDRCKAGYDASVMGINLYDSSMSAIVMIPSYDVNDSYFMNRTNNGVDSLSKSADEYLEFMSYYQAQLNDIDYRLSNIEGHGYNEAKLSYAEDSLYRLWERLDNISHTLYQVDRNYLQTKNRNCLTYRVLETDYISVKGLILYGAFGAAFVLALAAAGAIRKIRKESKR